MPKAKRMLASRCYAVVSGARDSVTNETDARRSIGVRRTFDRPVRVGAERMVHDDPDIPKLKK
jgi:hypothetical protein